MLLDQITSLDQEHQQLKEENDRLEADLLRKMPQQGFSGPMDIASVQGEIQRLMDEKTSLELQAETARREIEAARQQEQAVKENHNALLKGFKELKLALDADDVAARSHLDQLLRQLKERQQSLGDVRQQEEQRYSEEATKVAQQLIPSFSQTLKRATEEERRKTAIALEQVEREASAKFEVAAKQAADKYAAECERVLSGLMAEQQQQDVLADDLEKQVKAAEAKLKTLYSVRLREYQESAKSVPKADPATVKKLKDLRAGVRRLWQELNTDPERIIAFLESVRRVSPPDEKFYQLLCRTAEQLTAQLAIKQSIGQRNEMQNILDSLKKKCLETIASTNSVATPLTRMPAATKELVPKIDRYLSKTLVQQMRAQYKHVASSLAKVDARLMGYLRAYLAEFKEEYAHQGRPYTPVLKCLMRATGEFEKSLPKRFTEDAK